MDVLRDEPIAAAPGDRAVAPVGPLIASDKESCRECWGCVRCCPAKAIRVVDRHSEIISEKCVACGLCVSECGRAGHIVRDDTPRVWDLLDSGRPVVAVLASEFVAAMYPMRPADVERALEDMGFYAVESTVLGEEMVALAYANLCRRPGAFPVLRSTCPVIVEWVRRYHPVLAQALAPVVPPYVAQARLVRALYPGDIAVVYVSPCYARKDEIREPEYKGAIDVAIDFLELKRMIGSGRRKKGFEPPDAYGGRRPTPIKEISLTDGFPRDLVSGSGAEADVAVVRGLRAAEAVLNGIERGEAGPVIVDLLNCEGCIDGPAVSPGVSVFAKRNIEATERETQGRSVVSSRALLSSLPAVDLVRGFKSRPVVVPLPDDDEIDRILAEGGFSTRDDAIDCGACGYKTCAEHAVAIFQGNSTWDMCFPLQRSLLSSRVEYLEENETLDQLTGLWNRRMFVERLIDEVARYDRYGIPVSLMMVEVDQLAATRDERGAAAADKLLAGIGDLLRKALRVTDLPSRYDTNRFAVILPSMRKTSAFAVAEKVRALVTAASPRIDAEGYRQGATVQVSVGVASAGPSLTDATSLIESADGVLYAAKESGGDQVRLAPD